MVVCLKNIMINSNKFNITPSSDGFGATLSGVLLNGNLSKAQVGTILDAINQYAVVSFPKQDLTPSSLEDFSQRLGEFGHDPYVQSMEGFEHVIEVRRDPDETAPIFGSLWHSDWSFQKVPPSITALYSVEIPPRGGDTLFADHRRAFESLSPKLQQFFISLEGVHSAGPAYSNTVGLFSKDDDTRSMKIVVSPDADNCVTHPVVRRNLPSQRDALYVNHVYTTAIKDLSERESDVILKFLFSLCTREEFTYRHVWEPNTLLLWDNRCVSHYAEGGYEGYSRLLYRTTIAGEVPVPPKGP